MCTEILHVKISLASVYLAINLREIFTKIQRKKLEKKNLPKNCE